MKPNKRLVYSTETIRKPTGSCFYCGCGMFTGDQTHHRSDDDTRDHIIAKSRTTHAQYMDNGFPALNEVRVCHDCNHYKGHLAPLDWLVIMPSHEGAERLAKRLVELGFQMTEISEAMGRRKK